MCLVRMRPLRQRERYTPPMRAIVVKQFGGPEELRLGRGPDPKPAPGQVVVRLHAAGVNPYETYIRGGKYARLPELPYTPGIGRCRSRRIDRRRRDGCRAWATASMSPRRRARWGTYAERIACDAAMVHPLPDADLVQPGRRAWRAGRDGLSRAGHSRAGTRLRDGPGAWRKRRRRYRGHAVRPRMGLRVIGTAGTPEGLDAASGPAPTRC